MLASQSSPCHKLPGYLWHSNTDKIGKLKYMVKLESDTMRYMVKLKYVVKIVAYIWSKPNMIKFYIIKLKYMVKRKLWSFFPYMVKRAANIWSKFKKIPLHNSHGYDVSIS